jgi:hypothetical protein
MKKYYIQDGADQIGPLDVEELKQKGVNNNTPIWYEGIDNWTTIINVAELKGQFDQVKPPPFVKPPQYTASQQQAPPKPAPVNTEKKKSKSSVPLIVTIVVVVLAVLAVITFFNNPNSIPGVKLEINTPKPLVLHTSADNRKSDIKMRTTVHGTIQNQGGNGNVLVTFHLIQDGKTYDRTQVVSLNSGESRELEATFDEVRRLGGDMKYSVEAVAQ